MKKNARLIILYLGEGKGKTSAALGAILRSVALGREVLFAQFVKSQISSEITAIRKYLPKVTIIRGGLGYVGINNDSYEISEHQRSAQGLVKKILKQLKLRPFHLIILDEAGLAVDLKLISLNQIRTIIKASDSGSDLIITGRTKNKELVNMANLVTEMKKIKHPYDLGIPAKKGIDY